MTLINSIERFDFDSVDQAPEGPGVYAWYGKVYAAPADYRRLIDERGRDLGEESFRRVLARHTSRYALPPFRLKGHGTFGSSWNGALEDKSSRAFQSLLRGDTDNLDEGARGTDVEIAKDLDWLLSKEKTRNLLVNFLDEANPVFASPLYIGKSRKLRERLNDHVSLFRQIKDHISQDEGKLKQLNDTLNREDLGFAQRAVASDFSEETLEVFTIDFARASPAGTKHAELDRLANVVEWLLNRWFRPMAGRR